MVFINIINLNIMNADEKKLMIWIINMIKKTEHSSKILKDKYQSEEEYGKNKNMKIEKEKMNENENWLKPKKWIWYEN